MHVSTDITKVVKNNTHIFAYTFDTLICQRGGEAVSTVTTFCLPFGHHCLLDLNSMVVLCHVC